MPSPNRPPQGQRIHGDREERDRERIKEREHNREIHRERVRSPIEVEDAPISGGGITAERERRRRIGESARGKQPDVLRKRVLAKVEADRREWSMQRLRTMEKEKKQLELRLRQERQRLLREEEEEAGETLTDTDQDRYMDRESVGANGGGARQATEDVTSRARGDGMRSTRTSREYDRQFQRQLSERDLEQRRRGGDQDILRVAPSPSHLRDRDRDGVRVSPFPSYSDTPREANAQRVRPARPASAQYGSRRQPPHRPDLDSLGVLGVTRTDY